MESVYYPYNGIEVPSDFRAILLLRILVNH